jgi:hypothetical protein
MAMRPALMESEVDNNSGFRGTRIARAINAARRQARQLQGSQI